MRSSRPLVRASAPLVVVAGREESEPRRTACPVCHPFRGNVAGEPHLSSRGMRAAPSSAVFAPGEPGRRGTAVPVIETLGKTARYALGGVRTVVIGVDPIRLRATGPQPSCSTVQENR